MIPTLRLKIRSKHQESQPRHRRLNTENSDMRQLKEQPNHPHPFHNIAHQPLQPHNRLTCKNPPLEVKKKYDYNHAKKDNTRAYLQLRTEENQR